MKISVVCPFYNESAIIGAATRGMVAQLAGLPDEWELILVNDGSTDNSLELARSAAAADDRVRVVSYTVNQGRGFALKTGIDSAQGDLIVTTEVDLSWGETIVGDIVNKFKAAPELDVVVASPNLPGGGYRNVPRRRILISRWGNRLLRLLFTKRITMNTGMTRGYRRHVIQGLHIDEKGKEFHLEVLLKLVNLGYRIGEVPAVLEWKDHKLAAPGSRKRKSSSKIPSLVRSHLEFAFFANPIRYFGFSSLLSFAGAVGCGVAAVYRFLNGQVAIFLALVSLFLGLFALIFLGFGIVTTQNMRIMRELWRRR